MKSIDHVTDEELQEWVDGRLAEDARATFEQRLLADPALAARAAAYRTQNGALTRALEAKFEGPVPARLHAASIVNARRASRIRPAQVAALIAAVLVGTGIGTAGTLQLAGRPDGESIVLASANSIERDAVAAHLTYVVDVRHPVEVDAGQEQHLVQWLSKRLGKPLVAPNLEPLGYQLMGGRLLPASDRPAAQLMYQDEQGKRLTVYLRADPNSTETSFEYAKIDGLSGFQWADRGFGYVLLGEVERGQLLLAAKAIYDQTSVV